MIPQAGEMAQTLKARFTTKNIKCDPTLTKENCVYLREASRRSEWELPSVLACLYFNFNQLIPCRWRKIGNFLNIHHVTQSCSGILNINLAAQILPGGKLH